MDSSWIRRGCTNDAVAPRSRHERFVVQPRMHRRTAVERLRRGAFMVRSRCFHGVSTKWMRHDGVMERSLCLYEGSTKSPRTTKKASRRLHEAIVDPPWLLSGATTVASRSLCGALSPPQIRQKWQALRILVVKPILLANNS